MQKNRSVLIFNSRKSIFKRVFKVFSLVMMITMLFFAIDTYRKFKNLDDSATLSQHIQSGEYLEKSFNELIREEKLKYSPRDFEIIPASDKRNPVGEFVITSGEAYNLEDVSNSRELAYTQFFYWEKKYPDMIF